MRLRRRLRFCFVLHQRCFLVPFGAMLLLPAAANVKTIAPEWDGTIIEAQDRDPTSIGHCAVVVYFAAS